jgi:hypothetical protein
MRPEHKPRATKSKDDSNSKNPAAHNGVQNVLTGNSTEAPSGLSVTLFVKVLSCREDFLCFSFVSFIFTSCSFVVKGFGFPLLPLFLRVSKVLFWLRLCRDVPLSSESILVKLTSSDHPILLPLAHLNAIRYSV